MLFPLHKPVCVRSQGEVDKFAISILVSHIFPFLLQFFFFGPKQSIRIFPLLLLLAFCLGIHNENSNKIKASIKFAPKATEKNDCKKEMQKPQNHFNSPLDGMAQYYQRNKPSKDTETQTLAHAHAHTQPTYKDRIVVLSMWYSLCIIYPNDPMCIFSSN